MQDRYSRAPSVFTITLIQVLVSVLLFVSLLYNQRDLAVLSLFVLTIIGGARLWARVSPAGLRYRLTVDKRKVFPGERITVKASAENAKVLPIWLEMRISTGELASSSSGERVFARASSLLWFQRMHGQWELEVERRGVYRLGPLDLLTGDLFSFFSRNTTTAESYSIVAYPRLVPLNTLRLRQRDFFGVPRAKSPVQDPIYILGTRDYQQGQPSKYLHWKASARHNRLQEKVFESTVQEKVLLAIDVGSFAEPRAEDELERTLEVAASLAVRLDRQGHSVGLVVNGKLKGEGPAFVPVARDYDQVPAILEVLARIEMEPTGDMRELLKWRLRDAWGISCVYFAYAADETVRTANDYFAQRQMPVVFVVAVNGSHIEQNRFGVLPSLYTLDEIRAEGVETR